jgi:hypothetical protein
VVVAYGINHVEYRRGRRMRANNCAVRVTRLIVSISLLD